MLLTDNMNILKEAYPHTWKKIKSLEENISVDLVQFEDTKKGNKTLYVKKDEKKVYLHSKYDPVREAQAVVEEYKNVKEDTTVIFYGTGLGYHIDLFVKKYPNVSYYIYEPIPEILYKYLSYRSIKKMTSYKFKLKNIVLGDKESDIRTFLNEIIDKSNKNILHIYLSSHINVFPDEYKKFLELFKEILNYKKSNIITNISFQKRWTINSMKNFGEVLSTPNIVIEKRGKFKNKTAVLVAAGPSLNEEIENIRYIKENGLAYIFSVGSAINTLICNNIYPDAICTYDPKVGNQTVIRIVKDKSIKEIPIIFGSSVGYETLFNYPGDKYHMITSQDTVSIYYLKNEDNKDINMVQDAPSIALVTLQLLYEMQFSKIILVGQNLAYKGQERHSNGVFYSKKVTEEEMKKGILIKDVNGNNVVTNEEFNSMRQQMEQYIKLFSGIDVINTTKGGAHIEGTRFVELKEIIDKDLKEKIVEDNWLGRSKTNYDKDFLIKQFNKMERAYNRVLKINREYIDILNKIERAINNRNFSQAENLYIKLDKELRKIENNDYYKTFILPMNRVEYTILADSIDRLNDEKDLCKKGQLIVESFRNFIDLCTKDIETIDPIYEEMKESIQNYIENNRGNLS